MCTDPKSDSQIPCDGMAIVRQLDAARTQLGNLILRQPGWRKQLLDIQDQLCVIIIDVAAISTDDGSSVDIQAFLNSAEVQLPPIYLEDC